jgi:phosphatidylserine/phosphatidylglycerophosphate/cardiolipin synthase-like enzyme
VLLSGSKGHGGLRRPSTGSASPFLAEGDLPPMRPARLPHEWPFPVRDGCAVTPLIEAAEMYPALERLVLAARRSVLFSFRIFDPTTSAHTSEAKERGLSDWTAILRDAVMRGVTVRIILTDFEPVMAHDLHSLSWSSFQTLKAMAATLPPERLDDFQMIVVQHEGEIGWALRNLLRLPVGIRIRRLFAELEARGNLGELLERRPGLWPHHRWDGQRAVVVWGRLLHIWPATFHQKFAVIDESVAVLGGLDINERRYDDKHHERPAPRTWHDLSCRLEGPAVADAAEHFRRLWNAELPRFVATAREWMSGGDRRLVLEPLEQMEDRAPGSVPGAAGPARVQLLRTLSRRHGSPFAIGPKPRVREIMAAHRRLIACCEETLYIETQFFRFRDAARWIIRRAREVVGLEVIIVLPNAPEEVAFGKSRNPAHLHGEWLQVRALTEMRQALGERLGLFSLVRQEPTERREKEFDQTRGTAFGSGVVHVHSKTLIADGRLALVSSANINGRSFAWDTEFGMLWEDPAGVARFRRSLWRQLLETDEADDAPPGRSLPVWAGIAASNARVEPHERQGFVVPHQIGRARRFARPEWFVPDDLV